MQKSKGRRSSVVNRRTTRQCLDIVHRERVLSSVPFPWRSWNETLVDCVFPYYLQIRFDKSSADSLVSLDPWRLFIVGSPQLCARSSLRHLSDTAASIRGDLSRSSPPPKTSFPFSLSFSFVCLFSSILVAFFHPPEFRASYPRLLSPSSSIFLQPGWPVFIVPSLSKVQPFLLAPMDLPDANYC